ncbi:MAG: hypothetical protein P1P64_05675 [Treponemataceae bacterium]
MFVSDQFISEKILQISKHYNENIATRFLRPVFVGIFSDVNLMHNVTDLTEHTRDFVLQGQSLQELYSQIFAMANFIFLVRRDILPNLHNLSATNTQHANEDRVYRLMAFSSLPANINILADLLCDLFEAAVKYDKEHSRRRNLVLNDFPEAINFYNLLNKEKPKDK